MKISKRIDSPETREKKRLAALNHWKDPIIRAKLEPHLLKNNLFPKVKDTGIELATEDYVKSRRWRYEKHVLVEGVIVDLYLPDVDTVVMCDGCRWHGCPLHQREHGMPRGVTPEELRAKDAEVDSRIRAGGHRLVRLWEHDIIRGDFTAFQVVPTIRTDSIR